MTTRIQRLVVLSILIGLLIGIPLFAYALDIKEITFQGNTLIPGSSLLSQLTSKVGLPYNPEVVSNDLQTLYNIGLFSAIQADVEEVAGGVKLTFILKERPLITSITFKGNKKLKEDQLKEVLTLSPKDLSDPVKLKFYPLKVTEDIEKLKQLYHQKGFWNARITSAFIPDPADPQGKTALQYTIEENQKVKVRGINFKGNTTFSGKELQKTMMTKTHGLFSFITGSGKYEEETFQTDLERLKFFYADHGYIDMRVTDHALDFREKTGDLYMTITLEEGAMYTINTVAIAGNTVYATEAIQKVITVAPPEPFSRSKIWKDRVAIADLYAKKGYLTPVSENTEGKLLIEPKIQTNPEQKQIDLVYSIREGIPHFLNRISITGNKLTRDKVIRRELKVQEGELFDSQLMERSQQKVVNLALFDDVKFNVSDGPAVGTVDMDIDVTERSSIGSFNFGGGWSSLDKWTISGGFTASNLFGLAHEMDFSATIGGSSQEFNLSYTIPRVFDSLYTIGVDAYNIKREYSAYDSRSTGGGLRLGRNLSDFLFGTLKYQYERVKISDVDTEASSRIKEAEGVSDTSSVSALLRWTTLNNVLLPTKGLQLKLSGEVAGGVLQGDNNFYKIISDNNLYIPLVKNVALRFYGEYAYVKAYGDSEKVPIFERFFGGGMDVIRGYKERTIGPKDENDDPLGGNTRIVLTSEIIVPVNKSLRLLTFFDTGDVYGSDEDINPSTWKKSVGVGARLYTPFGLLKLDWGYKLHKEKGESDSEFHFGLGGLF